MAVRSALFVDHDNLRCGLGGAAATAFVEEPRRWTSWLEAGGDRPDARPRRFLTRTCYTGEGLTPSGREVLLRSGFQVVDCPRLTGGGKNAADIHLVIDVLDALAARLPVDEYVIASADADFTPLLRRLRAHGRTTTVVTAGTAAPAYLALADHVVTREQLVPLLDPAPPREPLAGPTADPVALAVGAVRTVVRRSAGPVCGSQAAAAARTAAPGLGADWAGAGTFGGFLRLHARDLVWHPPGQLSAKG